MSYLINTSFYEGPMDLIFDLITKKKLDIYEVSISEITQQYLQSIENISQMDMEIASEFVLMASRLLEIKSKYMLYISNENEEEDLRNLRGSGSNAAKAEHGGDNGDDEEYGCPV